MENFSFFAVHVMSFKLKIECLFAFLTIILLRYLLVLAPAVKKQFSLGVRQYCWLISLVNTIFRHSHTEPALLFNADS